MASKPNLTIEPQLYQELFQEEKKTQPKNQAPSQYKRSVLRLIAHLKKINTNE